MARAWRIEYPGAVGHGLGRGNQGRKIYADEGGRQMWLGASGEAWQRTGWHIKRKKRLAEDGLWPEQLPELPIVGSSLSIGMILQ
jgi:hypothetical protein